MANSARDEWDIISGVGLTALIVAAGRAVESHRPDRLVDDPWAERFVAAARPPKPLPTRPLPASDTSLTATWQMMSTYMGVRSRLFDETLLAAAEAGAQQVVILATGLDTRAHRLEWPTGTTVFEIDQPRVLDFKDLVLDRYDASPATDRRVIRVDLRDDWSGALLEAGFDPSLPSAWLAEGLLAYLPTEAERDLLSTIDKLAAPGSRVAVEDFTTLSGQLDDPELVRLSEELGADMKQLLDTGERTDPGAWFTDHGWQVQTQTAAAVADGYGREFDRLTKRFNADSRFVIARR
ncbi:SAM-dependent methyltransferase [Flexivirga meconopsidis]|uniref:SAM-dependent methyltransferase n=1 Tax=Flexivirga meconopsidis TaxID=2977121 RepID=UPI00223F3D39|nr:SAM-dependent methyltransferase [Flexivirga meconopsidis]